MELPSSYQARDIEPKRLAFWHKKGFFHFDPATEKEVFSIPIPPPNVTGVLHMGHALVNTLQDVMIRFKKMKGFAVFWAIGTDHAGIATQSVVEKKLLEKGQRRSEMTREEFVEECWRWKESREKEILHQLKKLGAAADFEKARFTMDDGCNRAVFRAFKLLFDKGLIYKGNYLVNWDPILKTALADDEVEFEERPSFLWHFRYPVKGGGEIAIATTRPETLLGDTAVAVSPHDPRYLSYIGKKVLHPLTGREIPIISDPFVDPQFGTGAVKITPAHDPNDYEMAHRHDLPMINLLCPDGTINEAGGKFRGLSFQEAREKVVEAMTQEGLFLKKDPHTLRVGVSYRSKAIIEPYLSKQWFVKISAYKERLREIVTNKECSLIPEGWEKTYFHWIDNLRDWCISRQLWWGHRIPIWTNKKDPSQILCLDDPTLDDPIKSASLPCEEWEQDPDVLDTWFSSALWPFSVMGWPEKTALFEKGYPNSLLITGYDILFFWVARMLFMGDQLTSTVPFPKVFLHGLIYGKSYFRMKEEGVFYVGPDERRLYDGGKTAPPDVTAKWEKMSKSKGNVIDPLEIIEEFGTDALRMTMCSMTTGLRECDLDLRKFEEFRNFANKIWNGARFVLLQIEEMTEEAFFTPISYEDLLLEDRWILSVLNITIEKIDLELDSFRFADSAKTAYDFFWDPFCSYYLEIAKPTLFKKSGSEQMRIIKQKLLLFILLKSMQLLHPMAPFITDEIFSFIRAKISKFKSPSHESLESSESRDYFTQELCQSAPFETLFETSFPKKVPFAFDEAKALRDFAEIQTLIYTLRNLRGEVGLSTNEPLEIFIDGPEESIGPLQKESPILHALVKLRSITWGATLAPYKASKSLSNLTVSLILTEEFRKKELLRLTKELTKTEELLLRAKAMGENPDFQTNAPKERVEKNREEILRLSSRKKELETALSQLVAW